MDVRRGILLVCVVMAETASPLAGVCAGSLYAHPSAGEQVAAFDKYALQWDCACVGTSVKAIDITLYQSTGGALHGWRNVPCAANTFSTSFVPSWWNSSATANLYLSIVDSTQPTWATSTGPGPVFTVNWNGTVPASLTGSGNPGNSTGLVVESVSNPAGDGAGLSGGKLGAAVAIPLVVAALGVGAYILYSRRKGKKSRKRWSAYVDQRYSQASQLRWEDGAPGVNLPDQVATLTTSRPVSMVQRGQTDPSVVLGYSSSACDVADRTSQLYETPAKDFTGDGRSNATHQYSYSNASAGPVSYSVRGDIRTEESNEHLLSLLQPREPPLRPATNVGQRPTSSFYAMDGHSIADYNIGDVASARRQSRYHKTTGSRGSRVSFINLNDSASGGRHGRSRSSYFDNGDGSLSSPNHHRYRSSVASSNYGVAHLTRPISASDSTNAVSTAGGSPTRSNKPQNIAVSTSMPFIAQPRGRESIMSPDDLLRAYASAKSPTSPNATSTDHQEHLPPAATETDLPSRTRSAKKPKFAGVMGFGFNR